MSGTGCSFDWNQRPSGPHLLVSLRTSIHLVCSGLPVTGDSRFGCPQLYEIGELIMNLQSIQIGIMVLFVFGFKRYQGG